MAEWISILHSYEGTPVWEAGTSSIEWTGTQWRYLVRITSPLAELHAITDFWEVFRPTKYRITFSCFDSSMRSDIWFGTTQRNLDTNYYSLEEKTIQSYYYNNGDISKIRIFETYDSAVWCYITNIEFYGDDPGWGVELPEPVVYDSSQNINQFRIYLDDGADDDMILKPSSMNLSKTYSYKYYAPGLSGGWFDLNWSINATIPDISNYAEIVARIDNSYNLRVEWIKQIVAGVESTEDMFDIPYENSQTGTTNILTIKANPVINYFPDRSEISLQCSYSWQVTLGAISELDAVEITQKPSSIKKAPSFEIDGDQYELSWPHPISNCHDARREITYGDISFYASAWDFSAGNKSMRTTLRERKVILVYDSDLM